jgi:hypothetical protein
MVILTEEQQMNHIFSLTFFFVHLFLLEMERSNSTNASGKQNMNKKEKTIM